MRLSAAHIFGPELTIVGLFETALTYNGGVKIILSPSLSMKEDDTHGFEMTQPLFQSESQILRHQLLSLTTEQLQKAWQCSDPLFKKLLAQMEPERRGYLQAPTPALLAFDGVVFSAMVPKVFTDAQWKYVNEHLRIVSGMYGLLRPLDGIRPYRLEMKNRIPFSLYEFWKEKPATALEDSIIINLASEEYARLIRAHLKNARMIEVDFQEFKPDGKLKKSSVHLKQARGAMVRWMAEHSIETPEDLIRFDEMGYSFDENLSGDDHLIFTRRLS